MTRTVTGECSLEIVAGPRNIVAHRVEDDARASRLAQISARALMSFSPMPPVKTSISSRSLRHVAADPSGDGPGELGYSKFCFGVAGVDGLAQIAHVVGEFADAQQAGLFADNGFQLIGGLQGVGVDSAIFLRMNITMPGSMSPVREPLMMPLVG